MKYVPLEAILICCYLGKEITLSKILEKFPFIKADGAYATKESQSEIANVAECLT